MSEVKRYWRWQCAEDGDVELDPTHPKASNAHLFCVAADDYDALKADNERLREVLENVRHGTVCPAQVGWLDAGPCTCGLAAALSPQETPK